MGKWRIDSWSSIKNVHSVDRVCYSSVLCESERLVYWGSSWSYIRQPAGLYCNGIAID